MNSTDNTAQTWRDLADQLTTEQIAQLDAGSRVQQPGDLLDVARDMAAQNLLQLSLSDVPVPDGATDVRAWCQDGDDGTTASRTVYGCRWTVGNVIVLIVGEQDSTGATGWQIEVQHAENTVGDLTAEQSRELSRVLGDAADTLEQLRDGNPWPVDSTYYPCCNAIGRHGQDCQEPPFMKPVLETDTDGHRDYLVAVLAVLSAFQTRPKGAISDRTLSG